MASFQNIFIHLYLHLDVCSYVRVHVYVLKYVSMHAYMLLCSNNILLLLFHSLNSSVQMCICMRSSSTLLLSHGVSTFCSILIYSVSNAIGWAKHWLATCLFLVLFRQLPFSSNRSYPPHFLVAQYVPTHMHQAAMRAVEVWRLQRWCWLWCFRRALWRRSFLSLSSQFSAGRRGGIKGSVSSFPVYILLRHLCSFSFTLLFSVLLPYIYMPSL